MNFSFMDETSEGHEELMFSEIWEPMVFKLLLKYAVFTNLT